MIFPPLGSARPAASAATGGLAALIVLEPFGEARALLVLFLAPAAAAARRPHENLIEGEAEGAEHYHADNCLFHG
jgi:hypothetical protein